MITQLIEEWDIIPSTQSRAIKLAQQGAPHGSYVIARHQSAGKGIHGSWLSPYGGFYCSIIVDYPGYPIALRPVTSVANIVAKFINHLAEDILVQVPRHSNDIMDTTGQYKIGGIRGYSDPKEAYAVFGIGVNIYAPTSHDYLSNATYRIGALKELSGGVDWFDFSELFIPYFLQHYTGRSNS